MSTWYRQGVTAVSRASWLSDTIVATLHTASETATNLDTSATVSQITAELAATAGYNTGGQTLTYKSAAYIPANSWGNLPATSTAYGLGAMMETGGTTGNIHRCISAGTSAASAPTYATAVGSTTTDGSVTWMCEGVGSMRWNASVAYPAGYVVRPTPANGFLYRATTANTSSGTQPTWPTVAGQTVTDGALVWECLGGGMTVYAAANPAWTAATFTGARYCILSDRTPTGGANQPLLGITDYGSGQSGAGGTFTDQFSAEGCLFVGAA